MTDQQLYFAIGVPVFAVIIGMALNLMVIVWQSRGIEKRLDGMDKRLDKVEGLLTLIQSDLKEFYKDIARLKERAGL